MAVSPPPPPGSSGGSNTVKNIIIGVITTVLASSIVYFLGFQGNHAEKEQIKLRKEASIEAWNSLMFYSKQFSDAGIRMICRGDTNSMSNDLINEYDLIIKNIGNIEKMDHVDNRLLSLVDRRISTLKDKKKATEDYYDQLNALGEAPEDDPRVTELYQKFLSQINFLETRDTAFIRGVRDELNKKYDMQLETASPFVVEPDIIYGDWTVDKVKIFQFKKDGSFAFEADSENYPGKWSLDSLTIHMNFDDGSNIDFTIKSGSHDFLMAFDNNGNPHFFCR